MFGGEEKKLFCMKNKLSGNTHICIYNIHTGIKKKSKKRTGRESQQQQQQHVDK